MRYRKPANGDKLLTATIEVLRAIKRDNYADCPDDLVAAAKSYTSTIVERDHIRSLKKKGAQTRISKEQSDYLDELYSLNTRFVAIYEDILNFMVSKY